MIQDTGTHPALAVSRSSRVAFAYVALVVVAGICVGRGMYSPWAQLVGVALCVPATVIVVWRASRSGENWGVCIHDRLSVLLALGGLFLAVSVALSVYRWSSLLGLLEGIGLIGLFTFARESVSSGWSRRVATQLLFWIGTGVSAVGLALFSVRGSPVGIVNRLVNALLVVDMADGKRLAIGFGYSNSFAAFLLIPLAAGLGLVLDTSLRWRRVVLAAGSLVMVIAMLESASRGGLLALGFMLIASSLLIVGASGGGIGAWKRLGYLCGAFAAAMAVLVIVPPLRRVIVDPVLERLLSMGTELQTGSALTSGMQGRLTMIRDALNYARAYPILGSGVGTYASTYMRFRTTMFFSSDPHSLPFKILAETGVVGLVLSSVIVMAVFRRFWHSVRDATHDGFVGVALYAGCATLLLHACMDWDFAFLAFPVMLSVICGMHAESGPMRQDKPAKAVPAGVRGRSREGPTMQRSGTRSLVSSLRYVVRPAVICWAVACGVLLTAALVQLGATRVASSQPGKALGLLEFASAIDPLNAEYPYERARTNVSLDTLVPEGPDSDRSLAIKSDFTRAIELNRYYPLYHIDYGRFLLQYKVSDAIRVYEELVEIDPMDPGTYTGLAASYLTIYQNIDKAGYWADKALSVDATYAEAYLVRGMVFERRGDVAAAAVDYQKASELDTASPDALVMLGTMEKKQGNLRAAARALCEASARSPRDASIRSALTAIAPVVDVSEPEEDYKISPGRKLAVRWDVSGQAAKAETWDIFLIPETGEWVRIATGLKKSDRSWTWGVPAGQTPGEYRVTIYARAPSQVADANGDWLTFGRSGIFTVQAVEGR